ncbi:MAG: hypothetical protein AAGH64_07415 [Planctomycetota bacterium]
MSHQDQSRGRESHADHTPFDDPRPPKVLSIGLDSGARDALDPLTEQLLDAPDPDTCWEWLGRGDFDALVIGPGIDRDDAIGLASRLAGSGLAARPVFADPDPSVTFSVDAMRSGAVDLIRTPIQTEQARAALDRAREQADLSRSTRRRVERLKKICQRLHASREDANRQVDVLCSDLASAYQEIARQMPKATMPNSTYESAVRSELDVEAILRMTLEHVLTKTGPTNAAVYLPTGSGDFALGAYVNYSLPSDTIDVALDHMADTLAPAFADDDSVHAFGAGELAKRVDSVQDWIGDATALVFTCLHEGETLAIGCLFRDAHEAFPSEAIDELDSVRSVFGAQLSRVIRIHNRHRPKDTWPGFEIDDHEGDEDYGSDWSADDDYGMAA